MGGMCGELEETININGRYATTQVTYRQAQAAGGCQSICFAVRTRLLPSPPRSLAAFQATTVHARFKDVETTFR